MRAKDPREGSGCLFDAEDMLCNDRGMIACVFTF